MKCLAVSLMVACIELLSIGGTGLSAQDLASLTPPKNITELVVDGNPSDFKIFSVVVDGKHLMDFGWKYTGTTPKNEDIRLPAGIDWRKRHVYFFAVEYINKTENYIRFIEGSSAGDSWIKNTDGTWKLASPRIVKRQDLIKSIDLYDVAPMADLTREDYYAYASADGKEPYTSTRYVYYVENMKLWFAVTFIRTSP